MRLPKLFIDAGEERELPLNETIHDFASTLLGSTKLTLQCLDVVIFFPRNKKLF